MTLRELISALENLAQNVQDTTEVMVETDGKGIWCISGVCFESPEPDQFPKCWNMPEDFVLITT